MQSGDDDNADNVAAARSIGMRALVTDSVATTRARLAQLLGEQEATTPVVER